MDKVTFGDWQTPHLAKEVFDVIKDCNLWFV